MTKIEETKEARENIIEIVKSADENEGQMDGKQELGEFVLALNERIKQIEEPEKLCLIVVMNKIKKDMQKWIAHYEQSLIGFDEAYEEVTSLYVFTEMYIN